MTFWWIAGLLVAVVGLLAIWAYRPLRTTWREASFNRARKQFHLEREPLEAKFFELAAASGKPNGLRWADCEFEDDVAYARDRRTGELVSFVGITIRFEAIEGGPMEGVEAVGNLRAATSVFHYRHARWRTFGRALFNLNPTEAIAHFRDDFEMVGHELASQR